VEVVHEIVAHSAAAAVLSRVIEQIGAYAGFASLIGLAILAALYFSQARDVKRLREWAGRAPERSAEVQAGGRTPEAAAVRTGQPASGTVQRVGPAQPVQPAAAAKPASAAAPGAAQPATPQAQPGQAKPGDVKAPPAAVPAAGAAATPAGAAASAAGAAPATATAPGAAPAGAKPADGGPGTGTPAKATPATAAPASGTPAKATPATAAPGSATAAAGATATPAKPAAGNAQPGNASGAAAPARPAATTGAKVLPARPAPPARPRPVQRPGASQTAVIPPSAERERVWPAPRYIALMVAGVIILGLGGTVGVLALTGKDNKSKSTSSQGATVPLPSGQGKGKSGSKKKKTFAPAIDPKTVTVTVVNGTSITGLARQMSNKVTAAGFVLGNIATASQQQRAESVVLFKPGANRQARAVASKVGISQIQAIDVQNSGLAGTATVVVVVGQDKAGGQ
jgi:hypothetical protein